MGYFEVGFLGFGNLGRCCRGGRRRQLRQRCRTDRGRSIGVGVAGRVSGQLGLLLLNLLILQMLFRLFLLLLTKAMR